MPTTLESIKSLTLAQVKEEQAKRFPDDPSGYITRVLHQSLWAKQQEVLESVRTNQYTLVTSGHTIGKSFLAACICSWFFDNFAEGIGLTTAPTWTSVREVVWGNIYKLRNQAGLPANAFYNFTYGTPTMLKESESHYFRGHNSKTSEGFQGRHGADTLIVLDEAPGCPDHIYEASESMLQAPESRCLAIGNPLNPSGKFYEKALDPNWHRITISSLDHPNIALELAGMPPIFPAAVRLAWVRNMIDQHCVPASPPYSIKDIEFPPGSGRMYKVNDTFRSRVLGIFPAQGSQSVWSEEALEVSRSRHLTWAEDDPICIGCDVARYGDDLTVLIARRGPVVLGLRSYSQRNTREVTGYVIAFARELAERFEVPLEAIWALVDDTGVGGGVTDSLLEDNRLQVVPVNAGERAYEPEKFINRRSELWVSVASRAESNDLDITVLDESDFRILSTELRGAIYVYNGKGQLVLEPKEHQKKRLKRSPDYADSLNLAFAPRTRFSISFA